MSYPVMLSLDGRLCGVVGAGKVAERKVVGLLRAGASVLVVGHAPTQHILDLCDQSKIIYHQRGFLASDLDGCLLAFAATNDPTVNDAVGKVAKEKGVLFCHSAGGEGDFTLPAVLVQDELTVAVSTGGSSPMYARIVKEALGEYLAKGHGDVLALLREVRAHLKENCSESDQRQEIWRSILTKETFDNVQSGNLEHVKNRIAQCL